MSLLALILIATGVTAGASYLISVSRRSRRREEAPDVANGGAWMDGPPRRHQSHDAGHHDLDAGGHHDADLDGHDMGGDADLDFDADDL